jgi:SAM-dependent methyltransferase
MGVNNLTDVFGRAIMDYYNGKEAVIETYSTIGGWDKLPVDYLFRSFDNMPDIEQTALNMASGSVLDLGCGAGSHALYLQNKGLEVKAIDVSAGAIEACRLRGVKNAELVNFWDIKGSKFDSILSLMNGAGICGSMNRVPDFLNHLKSLLQPGGQVLIDSSDVIYMFEDENGEIDLSEVEHYYGEVEFQSKYDGENSGLYPWLYIDFYNLQQQALHVNMKCELVKKGSHYDYLARLSFSE